MILVCAYLSGELTMTLGEAGAASTANWAAFGPFVLFPGQRQLKRDGKPIQVSDKAFDLLSLLVLEPGRIFSNDEIIEQVWQRQFVESSNLRVAVASLRKLLGQNEQGEDYIVNVVGRGYGFSKTIAVETWPANGGRIRSTEAAAGEPSPGRLPLLLKPVIGRAVEIDRVVDLLEQHRLITIVGPGGIGKTTLAVSVLSRNQAPSAIPCFVDFAPTQDAALVPARIAAALGLETSAADPVAHLLDRLSRESHLLIFDNCEHLSEPIGDLADTILRSTQAVRIVATSREALRLDAEIVVRLDGLTYPPEGEMLSADRASEFSAIQLLVERTQAAHPGFQLTDELAVSAAQICRRLDGIALAIQLAASRVPAFGMAGVAARLGDRFQLLSKGARTPVPRHRTLEAAFDWSFELLVPEERRVFERLSVFSGAFTLDEAIEIAASDDLAPSTVVEIAADLVDKSLVTFSDGAEPSYRMLETIRAFGAAHLKASPDYQATARRHALRSVRQCQDFAALDPAEGNSLARAAATEILDDLRTALDWAFDNSELELAQELVSTSIPLMFHVGLTFELRSWIVRSLKDELSAERRVALLIGLGGALHLSRCDPDTQTEIYCDAYGLADELGDVESGLQALWGMHATNYAAHRHRDCVAVMEQFIAIARREGMESEALVGECAMATALHDLGELTAARERVIHVLENYSHEEGVAGAHRFLFNHRAVALGYLSCIEWKLSRWDNAAKCLEQAAIEAGNHAPSIFHVLGHHATVIALESGRLENAAEHLDALDEHSRHHPMWHVWVQAFREILQVQSKPSQAALDRLNRTLAADDPRSPGQQVWFCLHAAKAHLALGQRFEARAVVEKAVEDTYARDEYWLLPEILRVRAEIEAHDDRSVALATLVEGAEVALRIGAPAWFARIADSCRSIVAGGDGLAVPGIIAAGFASGPANIDHLLRGPVRSACRSGAGNLPLLSFQRAG